MADGKIEAGSKDAINGGQLKTELDKKLDAADLKDAVKTTVKVAAGKNTTVSDETDTEGNVTYKVNVADETIRNVVKDDIAKATTTVKSGDDYIVVEDESATAGPGGTADPTKPHSYKVTLSDAVIGKLDTAEKAGKGEAGPIVYTDGNGERVVRLDNGDLYLAKDLDSNGAPKSGAQKVADTDVEHRLVNVKDGSTTVASKLSNVADGKIETGSKDAINGGQMKTELDKKLDKADLKDAVKSTVKVAAGQNTTVSDETDSAGNVTYKVNVTDETIRNVVKDDIAKATTTVESADDYIVVKDKSATAGPGGTADPTKPHNYTVGLSDKMVEKLDTVDKIAKGETGPVVYTDKDGQRVVKVAGGDFYLAKDLGSDGTPNAGAQKVAATDVEHRLANAADSSTTVASKLSNVADGEISATSKDAINGSQLFNTLKDAGINSDAPVVTYDSKEMQKVTLGGKDSQGNPSKAPVVIDNLADGKIAADSHEAVNGGQLHTLQVKVDGNTQNITNLTTKVDKNTQNITDLGTRVDNNTQNITNLNSGLSEVRDQVKGTASLSAAMAALQPLDYDPLEKTQMMAGVGHYKGKSSFALGVAHHDNNDFMVHGGIAYSSTSDVMVNAGLAWRFGPIKNRDRVRMADSLNGKDMVIELRNRVDYLMDENQKLNRKFEYTLEDNRRLNNRVDNLAAENSRLKQEIEQIKALLQKK